jgi:hypothetical protein
LSILNFPLWENLTWYNLNQINDTHNTQKIIINIICLLQRRPTQMWARAAFSKNRLMKGQIFRKFQWFCWFFSKRTISRESWRAAEKSFKGRGLADAGLLFEEKPSLQSKSILFAKNLLCKRVNFTLQRNAVHYLISHRSHSIKCQLNIN